MREGGAQVPKVNLYAAVIFILIGALAIIGLALLGSSPGSLRAFVDRIERHHQLIIVLFTAILALATGLLWWSTRSLVLDARDTAQRQLRAYVGPFSMEMEVYPYEKGGFVAMVHADLRNFGQTPAYDVRHSSWCKFDDPNALPFNDVQDPAVWPKAGIAYPDAGLHIRLPCFLSEQQVQELRDRKKIVFFWGTVNYEDGFRKPHYFRFRLVSQERTLDKGEVYRMGPHALGYEAD
jgi:hypothetical protein